MTKFNVTVKSTQYDHITIDADREEVAKALARTMWQENEGDWSEPSYIEITDIIAEEEG
jgi:hypothetical protein